MSQMAHGVDRRTYLSGGRSLQGGAMPTISTGQRNRVSSRSIGASRSRDGKATTIRRGSSRCAIAEVETARPGSIPAEAITRTVEPSTSVPSAGAAQTSSRLARGGSGSIGRRSTRPTRAGSATSAVRSHLSRHSRLNAWAPAAGCRTAATRATTIGLPVDGTSERWTVGGYWALCPGLRLARAVSDRHDGV